MFSNQFQSLQINTRKWQQKKIWAIRCTFFVSSKTTNRAMRKKAKESQKMFFSASMFSQISHQQGYSDKLLLAITNATNADNNEQWCRLAPRESQTRFLQIETVRKINKSEDKLTKKHTNWKRHCTTLLRFKFPNSHYEVLTSHGHCPSERQITPFINHLNMTCSEY